MTADVRLIYRPMRGWTDPVTDDEDRTPTSRFKGQVEERVGDQRRKVSRPVPLFRTERDLLREASMLDASEVIVEIDAPASAFRVDGSGLKSNVREPEFPGVVVYLTGSRFGDLRYSCDQFAGRYQGELDGWEGNLRAIALGLESLRQVERYGIARRGEQYAGWAELPPGTPLGAPSQRPAMTLDEACRRLSGMIDGVTALDVHDDVEMARTCYRMAVRRLHPDNLHTGNAEAFLLLQEAWELVEKHHAG